MLSKWPSCTLSMASSCTNRKQCYSPPAYRAFIEGMNQRNNRGWVIDVPLPPPLCPIFPELSSCSQDHDVTIEFYFRSFAELNRVNTTRNSKPSRRARSHSSTGPTLWPICPGSSGTWRMARLLMSWTTRALIRAMMSSWI
ncbi:hypothetical protein BDW74DRAFT_61255 [Aspergillus multicolor]|uniref:uncharacterized protein n=1 Tax=Aspergillus multicolor TaxID=41759 RepID=UPI003CCD6E8D